MQKHMSDYDFIKAFENLSEILYLGNMYLSESKFWSITDEAHLNTILYTTFEVIRLSSILLQPYSPSLTEKILDFIGVPKDQRTF
jgi:methionyl-tRNA synthetase